MKREDDPELWDLLGRSAEPKVSSFFARNVVRETRRTTGSGNLREWFSLRTLLPASAVAVALIAVILLRTQAPVVPLADPEADIFSNVDPQDHELVADLDDVLESDEADSWDESVLL